MPRPRARRRGASRQHAHARTQSYLGDIRASNAVELLQLISRAFEQCVCVCVNVYLRAHAQYSCDLIVRG